MFLPYDAYTLHKQQKGRLLSSSFNFKQLALYGFLKFYICETFALQMVLENTTKIGDTY